MQVAFRMGPDGKTDSFFVDHMAYRRLRWYEYPRLQLALFAGFGMLFGLAGLGWPIGPFWFAGEKNRNGTTAFLERSHFWAGLGAWLNGFFFGGVLVCVCFLE